MWYNFAFKRKEWIKSEVGRTGGADTRANRGKFKIAQNQEEYQKQYEKLVNEYEITKVEHQKLELDISNKLAKSETLSVFINTIKKQETLLETFDEMMWGSLLESVVVYKDNVLFKFRDGTEIKG